MCVFGCVCDWGKICCFPGAQERYLFMYVCVCVFSMHSQPHVHDTFLVCQTTSLFSMNCCPAENAFCIWVSMVHSALCCHWRICWCKWKFKNSLNLPNRLSSLGSGMKMENFRSFFSLWIDLHLHWIVCTFWFQFKGSVVGIIDFVKGLLSGFSLTKGEIANKEHGAMYEIELSKRTLSLDQQYSFSPHKCHRITTNLSLARGEKWHI